MATTVTQYLAALPSERAAELKRVRATIRRALPKGYEEAVTGTVIAYQVPLATYPDTYNGRPLWLAALAAPKTTLSLHLMPVYANSALLEQLQAGFATAGKPLRMGKGCINFRSAEDLALDAIADIVSGMPVQKWVEIARSARARRKA